jgi:hypothetical protein
MREHELIQAHSESNDGDDKRESKELEAHVATCERVVGILLRKKMGECK